MSRAMPVATLKRCSHRGGGHINRRGEMICGECDHTVYDTQVSTPDARFDEE